MQVGIGVDQGRPNGDEIAIVTDHSSRRRRQAGRRMIVLRQQYLGQVRAHRDLGSGETAGSLEFPVARAVGAGIGVGGSERQVHSAPGRSQFRVPDFLEKGVRELGDALGDRHEMLGVVGQHPQHRRQIGGDLDDLVGVVLQRIHRGAGGVHPGADECTQLFALLGESLHGFHRLMQGIHQIRRGRRQPVGSLHQCRYRRRPLVGRDNSVELIQYAVELRCTGE